MTVRRAPPKPSIIQRTFIEQVPDSKMVRSALLIASLVTASFGAAFAEPESPASLIAQVYGAGPAGHYQQPLAIFVEPSLRERYLPKRLRAALAEMDQRTPEGDVPNIDFDVVSDSRTRMCMISS